MKAKVESNILIQGLLIGLNIIIIEKRFVKIDTFPDYDFSSYEGSRKKEYHFKNSWSFLDLYDSLIEVSIEYSCILTIDNIDEITNQLGLNVINRDFTEILNEAYLLQSKIILENSFEPNYDEFELRNVVSEKIDNVQKRWHYSGVFEGDLHSIEPDWELDSLVKIKAINKEIHINFYKSIIAESYLLYLQGNYKLSYFLLYTALENFLFGLTQKGQIKQRLVEIKKMYNLESEVYFDLIFFEEEFTNIRNDIAHAKKNTNITRAAIERAFVIILKSIIEINLITYQYQ